MVQNDALPGLAPACGWVQQCVQNGAWMALVGACGKSERMEGLESLGRMIP